LQVIQAAGLVGMVRTASTRVGGAADIDRVLPVLPALRSLLPDGGLRRGALISVTADPGAMTGAMTGRAARSAAAGLTPPPTPVASMTLTLSLLAAASRAGSWCGIVGVPTLGAAAAAELGISLDRLALVPHPGVEWPTVVAALLDGLDIVVAAPPGPIMPAVTSRLVARARQRGSVLVAYGSWQGADVTLHAVRSAWSGLTEGHGRLRWRELTVRASGRGAAEAPRRATIWLPGPPPEAISPGRAARGSAEQVSVGLVSAEQGSPAVARWDRAG
jgi:hypothetical protein